MQLQSVLRFIGFLILFLGIALIFPLLVSLIYHDSNTLAMLYAMLIALSIGLFLFAITKSGKERTLNHRDGVAIVTFGWIAAGMIGAIPYLTSGSIVYFTDAYFESMSGFTTTGASIFNDIEGLPKEILLWRSITQWVGGMGIIVLSIAILPLLGVGGMQLYKAEVPSPVVDKLKPRISDTAKSLWKVYVVITVLEIALLYVGGMNILDSVCHAFCTMPTGGFSTRNLSIAYYGSTYFDVIIICFMVIAGINFSLHYKMIKGNFSIFGKDPECRVYLILVLFFILLIVMNIHGTVYEKISESFRYAAFQVSSIITTTGFATADFDKWPSFSKIILLLCMFIGAMAGSTGGGIKIMRLILLVKHAYVEIFKIIHPHAVKTVKLGKQAVPNDVLNSIVGFFILYLALVVIATLILSLLGLDMVSAFSSVAACIFNIGPGLGSVGPINNYHDVPLIGKWVLILCMLMGRLEIYTVIVLFLPEYWRK